VQRRLVAWALALALWTPGAVSSAPPASVRVEVGFLLASSRDSGCMFFRNGTRHEGKAAEAHLRDKFDHAVLRGRIGSTEDFIEGAATGSGLNGVPHAVKCAGSEAVPGDRWLRDRLAQHRAGDASGRDRVADRPMHGLVYGTEQTQSIRDGIFACSWTH